MKDKLIYTELIQSLLEKLRTYYVFPDIAEKICIGLQKHLDDGAYDDIIDGKFLAYVLTTHMQEICQDEHLWVKWHKDPLADDDEALRLNKEWVEQQQLQAQKSNFGFHKVERMAGNVGYVDIRYFHRPEWGGDIAVSVMKFLSNSDVLIIDLRKCPGGYPGMVELISSYLLGGEPQHLNSIYWRDDDVTRQYWTLPYVPGKKLDDKPLYILISKQTFSGGEGLAYDMQARSRAILIGEKTDGGAHPGASYRLHANFEVFIPIGCVTHPITDSNWEGVGVTPDVKTEADQALKEAHKMALETIINTLGKPKSGPMRLLLVEAREAYKELKKKSEIPHNMR